MTLTDEENMSREQLLELVYQLLEEVNFLQDEIDNSASYEDGYGDGYRDGSQ